MAATQAATFWRNFYFSQINRRHEQFYAFFTLPPEIWKSIRFNFGAVNVCLISFQHENENYDKQMLHCVCVCARAWTNCSYTVSVWILVAAIITSPPPFSISRASRPLHNSTFNFISLSISIIIFIIAAQHMQSLQSIFVLFGFFSSFFRLCARSYNSELCHCFFAKCLSTAKKMHQCL